jgi:hypothetical protein
MNRLTLAAACVFALALFASPPTAHARRLWIAWDAGTDSCMAQTLAWYDCLFHHTNFNAMIEDWPLGEPITEVAGTAVISGCGYNAFQCVVDRAGFAPAAGDIVLHFWGDACVVGHNYWRTTVTVGGHTVAIHGAEAKTSNTCSCQQALGMHELYEAAAMSVNADCCNAQVGVGDGSGLSTDASCAHPPSWVGGPGWYVYNGCPDGVPYRAQLISPASNWTNISGCMQLGAGGPCTGVADGTYCGGHGIVGGDPSTLYRCSGGTESTVAVCPGGCTASSGGADGCSFQGSCTTMLPSHLCSGERAAATITCHNDGSSPWPAGVAVGSFPTDRDSLFADTSWSSPRVAVSTIADVAPGASYDFAFMVRAPDVLAPISYTQQFAVLPGGAGGAAATSPAPSSLAMDVTVTPCDPDGGTGASPDASSLGLDGGSGRPPHGVTGGCCSVPASSAPRHGALLASLALATAVVRRRSR